VQLREVGPRDGLQNEQQVLPVATRLELIRRLAGTGLRRIEAASFVNPERVPQMAGAEEVAAGLDSGDGILFTGLALNERGYDRLRETGLGEVSFALAATETFSQRNAGASVEDSVAAGERIVSRAREDRVRSSVTISVAFGCPFEGPVDPEGVVALAERVVAAGPDELVLADTIGVATQTQ
jgi:isopropylmalate/homocitrate/citramalate synthase